jgi:ethanolamine ammonia-lyase small subunit
MSEPDLPALVTDNPWQGLRGFTPARIALGRSGTSLPTAPQLAFQLAHAQARDAVHVPLDAAALAHSLEQAGVARAENCVLLHSAAPDRSSYLQRPDWGRRLSAESQQKLAGLANRSAMKRRSSRGFDNAFDDPSDNVSDIASDITSTTVFDIAFVIADGLSARAAMQTAAPLMAAVLAAFGPDNWRIAPITIVQQARVAIGDEIATRLGAGLVVILIGERPGLSSPDSLGAYLTWAPRVGCLDSERNCISNIRPAGLRVEQAASKLHYLATQMRRRQISGVALKDAEPTGDAALQRQHAKNNSVLLVNRSWAGKGLNL